MHVDQYSGGSIRPLAFAMCLMSLGLLLSVYGARADDIELEGDTSITLEEDAIVGNVTLRDFSRLWIQNCRVRVKGVIKLEDSSSLFVSNATMALCPPAVPSCVSPMTMTDRSIFKVNDGSDVIFNPQPSPSNISYMFAGDSASFLIIDSSFEFTCPEILNQSIEGYTVTAGVLLFSGTSTWTIKDSTISAKLNITDTGEQKSRWFWCTMHQNTRIELTNSIASMNSPLNPIFKPVSGSFVMLDSKISEGFIDGEVTARMSIDGCDIYGLNVRDQSELDLSSTKVRKMTVGITAPFTEVSELPQAKAVLNDLVVTDKMTVKGASDVTIAESRIESMAVSQSATVSITDARVDSSISTSDSSTVLGANCTVGNMTVDDTSVLDLDRFGSATRLVMREGGSSTAVLTNGTVNEISVYQDHVKTVRITNVSVAGVSFWDNVTIQIDAVDSRIDSFIPWRRENITISMIVEDSVVPSVDLDENITAYRYHRFTFVTSVNGVPVEADVRMASGGSEYHEMTAIAEGGSRSMTDIVLPYQSFQNGSLKTIQEAVLKVDYLGLTERDIIDIDSSKKIVYEWKDPYSPKIESISYSPSVWNAERDIFVKAKVSDDGVGALRSVTLNYSSDGSSWIEVQMYEVGNGTFEAMIPGEKQGARIRFKVKAKDTMGNSVESPVRSIVVGLDEARVNSAMFAFLVLIVILISGLQVRRLRRSKRFLRSDRRD